MVLGQPHKEMSQYKSGRPLRRGETCPSPSTNDSKKKARASCIGSPDQSNSHLS